jgi:hypothetical protein
MSWHSSRFPKSRRGQWSAAGNHNGELPQLSRPEGWRFASLRNRLRAACGLNLAIARGDLLFGQFLTSGGSHLVSNTDDLLVEAISRDPVKQLFNFCELLKDRKSQRASWFFRGDSSLVLADIQLLYEPVAPRQPDAGRERRAFNGLPAVPYGLWPSRRRWSAIAYCWANRRRRKTAGPHNLLDVARAGAWPVAPAPWHCYSCLAPMAAKTAHAAARQHHYSRVSV